MPVISIKIVKSFDLNMPQWSPGAWNKTKYIKKKKKLISNKLAETYSAYKYALVPDLKQETIFGSTLSRVYLAVGTFCSLYILTISQKLSMTFLK